MPMIPLVAAWAASLIACWFGGMHAAGKKARYWKLRTATADGQYEHMEERLTKHTVELAKEVAELGVGSARIGDARDRYYGLWQDAIAPKIPKPHASLGHELITG